MFKKLSQKNLEVEIQSAGEASTGRKQDLLASSAFSGGGLGLKALEPRILLDAAAVVTGAEMAAETQMAEDVQATIEAIDFSSVEKTDISNLLISSVNSQPISEGDAYALAPPQNETLSASDKTFEAIASPIKDFTGSDSLSDDGAYEIHAGETINVDLRANDFTQGDLQGIIDPAAPDSLIALNANEPVQLTSGLGVELLEDGTFNVTGPNNPTERFVSFDYVVETEDGTQSQATATFDWPVAPTIDLNVADMDTANRTVFFDPTGSLPVRLANVDAIGDDLDGEEIVSLTLNISGFTAANQESILVLNPDGSTNAAFPFQPTAGAFPQNFFFNSTSYDATVDSMNGVYSIVRNDGLAMSSEEINSLIRAIAYDNNDSTISTNREISFTLNDGTLDSNVAAATVVFDPADLPVLESPTIDLDFQDSSTIVPGQGDFTSLNFSNISDLGFDGQTEEANNGDGEFVRYSNVGTIDGQAIDVVATVVRFITDMEEFVNAAEEE